VQYFHKLSGIPDDKGRAGNFPGRLEAEDAKLTGYKVIDVTPWEDASRGKAVSCEGQQRCAAEWTYNGTPGTFDTAIQYFDLAGGVAHFTLSVNDKPVADWAADAQLPSNHPNGDNSTRFIADHVALKPGDTIRVDATHNEEDPAALDYIEVQPVSPE
jgi:alpha-glucuronidase